MNADQKLAEYKSNLEKNGSRLSEKAAKYQFISPRFVNGEFVAASPEKPAVVSLPAGSKIDRDLTEVEGEAEPVKLEPHHAGKTPQMTTGAEHFSKPPKEKR